MTSASEVDVDFSQLHREEVELLYPLHVQDILPYHVEHVVLAHQR